MNGSKLTRKKAEKYFYAEFAERITNLLQNLVEGEGTKYSVLAGRIPGEFIRSAGFPGMTEGPVLTGIPDLCQLKYCQFSRRWAKVSRYYKRVPGRHACQHPENLEADRSVILGILRPSEQERPRVGKIRSPRLKSRTVPGGMGI